MPLQVLTVRAPDGALIDLACLFVRLSVCLFVCHNINPIRAPDGALIDLACLFVCHNINPIRAPDGALIDLACLAVCSSVIILIHYN